MKRTRPPRAIRGGLRFAAALLCGVLLGTTLPTVAAGPTRQAAKPQSKAQTHEESEGLTLAARERESGRATKGCKRGKDVRLFKIAAIGVEITLNRFGDHDPLGRMYALQSRVAPIRAEERTNRSARSGAADARPAASLGLQGDDIQPLTLRGRPGECVRISLRNDLKEPASLHMHSAPLQVVGGRPAIATNKNAMALPGGTVEYEWAIPASEPEGTHYFHSHGNAREQTSHGLFGALIVEPAASTWKDPRTGEEARGWDAMITAPGKPAFREFALYYHEIGNENYRLLDASGNQMPLVDPLLSAYRPGARAINYRSEPFLNRMRLQQKVMGRFDESLAYSSYAFGDPATPVLRSYLGEPTKQRVIHGGSEVSHVHHVHGGSVRWPRRPGLDKPRFAVGFTKKPALLPGRSERTDSQSIGPSETFDTENECGAGGCQGSVGDFLVHCHVAHHYFAGMWGIWRVYNTLQSSGAQTDQLPVLLALPETKAHPAVDSADLRTLVVDWMGTPTAVRDSVAWATRLLPPRGVPSGYDASVWDWRAEGNVVRGEADDPHFYPRPTSERYPRVLFDLRTGLLAYPFLRPHLGKRPPFAPNHGPAPYLNPGENVAERSSYTDFGPRSLCPKDSRASPYRINAINVPVPLNRRLGLTDPDGQIYALAEDEPQIRRDPALRVPLVIRANAQQDCVDIVFATSLPDAPITHGFAKANIHIHFVQFDVQASDGVVTGFNFEQSVRPYSIEGTKLLDATPRGSTKVRVANAARFKVGATIAIGLDTPRSFEARRIVRIDNQTLTLDRGTSLVHNAAENVSTEFVRHRWYPDAQTGTAYFHDHVNALESWRHGLFGALVVEPPGSTYHDPRTGKPLRSGALADIHTTGKVSADLTGSFREAVLILMDDVPITSDGRGLGGAINMRAEPLRRRGAAPFDARGDPPETPLIEANLGDPIVLRTLVGATNDVHTFHLDGHWFRAEAHDAQSPPVSTVRLGISERFDLVVPAAGGPQRMPGDYRYGSGRPSKIREGAWGLLRVHDSSRSPLRGLPRRDPVSRATEVCPAGSRLQPFDIAAVDAPTLRGPGAPPTPRVFVAANTHDAASKLAANPAESFVLRAAAGDCIELRVSNFTDRPVEPAADLLAYDPVARSSIPAKSTSVLRLYATPELGERVALVVDASQPDATHDGLFAAIVIGPKGVRYFEPKTGKRTAFGGQADAVPPTGRAWRDAVLFMSDDDAGIGTHQMPYSTNVSGVSAFGYRAEPLAPRRKDAPTNPFGIRDPSTPIVSAYTSDPMRIHVVAASSEQTQVFSIEGHRWPPRQAGRSVSSEMIGGMEVATLIIAGGAGAPGDYLYANHREPYREAGMWGIVRAQDRCSDIPGLRPLPGATASCASPIPLIAVAAAILAALGLLIASRRRRRSHALPSPAGDDQLTRSA